MGEPENQPVRGRVFKPLWAVLFLNLLILLLLVCFVIIGIAVTLKFHDKNGNALENSVSNSNCNIQVVDLNGTLDTSSKIYYDGAETGANSTEIIAKLMEAERNEQVKGVVLSVDSGGGTSVAGSEIAEYLSKVSKPSVAWVRTSANSAAYWASLGAKKIIANQNSSIGSIGVTYSYVDSTQRDENEGLVFQQLSIGKFKDAGNPSKPLTSEEKQLFLNEANTVYENFVSAVAHYRNLKVEKVKELADGAAMLGQEALRNNLIDEVGGISEVSRYFESRIGSKIDFCWK